MKKYIHWAVWIGALALIACALLVFEFHFLWKVQEMNLFLNTSLFFDQLMLVPGGLLSWMGTFFTQYLYYPWVGLLMLCCWWLLTMWLTKRAFLIPNEWAVLLLIPVAILLITIVDMGYWVYILKLRGYFFVTTIGTAAVAAMLWAFRCIPSRYFMRTIFVFLCCAAGYPLMGIYGLAAPLLMAIWTWHLDKNWIISAINSVVAVASVIVVPLICYSYFYCQTNLANIYWAELPLFFTDAEYPNYYIPYYLLAAFYVVLAAGYKLWPRKIANAKWKLRLVVQLLILAVIVIGVKKYWYNDENFHHELAMQHSIEQMDWEGVIAEAAKQQDEPTRAIVMMRNLALARLGRQGNEMFHYKNGSKKSNAPFLIRMMQEIGPLIYYHYGMINYSNRYSVEMGVEYGWRPEYYKNLARCAILNGDKQLARKYLGLLKHTTFFSSWAEHYEDLLNHPEKLATDPETGFITHMMHYDNNLTSDQGYVELFLMKQLSLNYYTGDPVFQEQTLLASLFTKDMNAFRYHLVDYMKLHPNKSLPIHYQEAAMVCYNEGNYQNLDEWTFIEAPARESYNQFEKLMYMYRNMEKEEMRNTLYPLIGQTYYYYAYLMDELLQY